MFGLFRKKPPPDPPTEKQLRYAARLGIAVSPKMSKADVSAAIADAERRNPEVAAKRERVKERIREQKFGKELIALEQQWDRFSDEVGYMLAIYNRGKDTIVDVLHVNQAIITDRGKLKLIVEAPKVVKDRDTGDYLEWSKGFELPIESLLQHEPLHENFDMDGNQSYKRVVEKGLKMAKRLQR